MSTKLNLRRGRGALVFGMTTVVALLASAAVYGGPGCPGGGGDCCLPGGNGTPGCDDLDCCNLVCSLDPFCCDTSWDGACATAANNECGVCGTDPVCPGEGCCYEDNGTPGCNDEDCCETVCAIDAFCCDTSWDGVCAGEAAEFCVPNAVCGDPGAGDCCAPGGNGTPGCDDLCCCESVCLADSFCCDTSWDGLCADQAIADPNCDCGPVTGACCLPDGTCVDGLTQADCENTGDGPSDCCIDNGTPGCSDQACQDAICAADSFCCDVTWDGICADAALLEPACQEGCNAPPAGLGGVYQGDGTTCDTVSCPPPTGACCLPDGTCVDGVTQADCENTGDGPSDCCIDNGTPGCSDQACQDAICAADSFCCDVTWDGICADAALLEPACQEGCNAPPGGLGGVYQGDGTTCDTVNCIAPPANDDCIDRIEVFDGATPFSNVGATTDGPDEPDACTFFGYSHIDSDVWFNYTATCTGEATFSLCGSGYDTKMAVYNCDCAELAIIACNDDSCDLQSEITIEVVEGECYKIRIGGYEGAQGEGTLTISCVVPVVCGDEGTGDCCVANGTPYCDDADCCEEVCAADSFCCDVSWDGVCAGLAFDLCNICVPKLSLEVPSINPNGCVKSDQVEVEVWMRDLTTGPVTGFQAFIQFDDTKLAYNGGLSFYTDDPFPLHVQDIVTAEVAAGEIRIDGIDDLGDPGTDADSLLAILVFDVLTECMTTAVEFDVSQAFASELSFDGDPIPTKLVNTPDLYFDFTAPDLGDCPESFSVISCGGAIVDYPAPSATDNCDGDVAVICDPPSGSFFPVGTTTVTCTATDSCGNESSCSFDITVIEKNIICVTVDLPASVPGDRCIHFVTDDCAVTADVTLTFIDHDNDPLTPVRAEAEIEVDCGDYLSLCGKDEQHTQWDTTSLTFDEDEGKYVADGVLTLLPGDNDNDGDVDINDLTLIVAQFGGPEPDGGCPWDGTRGADYSNNGDVGAEDYSAMTPQWLTQSTCACTSAAGGGIETTILASSLDPRIAARVDLNRDGVFDHRDVAIFEAKHDLPNVLSERMRRGG